MKVGILTFHRAANFGTALQAIATQKALEKVGIQAQLIDYRPQYIERTLQRRKIKNAKSVKELASICINSILYPNMTKRKTNNFLEFLQYMNVSDKVCTSLEDVKECVADYDVIVSGSDQLFNKNITSDDLMYFLPFEHKKKVSYASSFGESQISKQRIDEIAPYLCDFDSLSVREKTAQNILSDIRNEYSKLKPATNVIDPTFLLTSDEWNQYADNNLDLPQDGFILTYYMIETPLLSKITKKLEKKTGLPVVNLKPSKKQVITHNGKNLAFAGPSQLISCYGKASYIVTNSFHGAAFAINYHKPFYVSSLPVSMAGEVNSRLTDLLELFSLKDRWINDIDVLDSLQLSSIDESVKQKLDKLKQDSFDYLSKALGV